MNKTFETISESSDKTRVPADHLNDIHRYISQAQSVLNALNCEGNHEELPEEAMSSVLLLVSDRLDDIQTSVDACWAGSFTPNS
jgi:hypothetical protein